MHEQTLSSVVQIIHLVCVLTLVFVFHKLDLFLNFSSLKQYLTHTLFHISIISCSFFLTQDNVGKVQSIIFFITHPK